MYSLHIHIALVSEYASDTSDHICSVTLQNVMEINRQTNRKMTQLTLHGTS